MSDRQKVINFLLNQLKWPKYLDPSATLSHEGFSLLRREDRAKRDFTRPIPPCLGKKIKKREILRIPSHHA